MGVAGGRLKEVDGRGLTGIIRRESELRGRSRRRRKKGGGGK